MLISTSFDIVASSISNIFLFVGKKTILVKTTSHKRTHFTVVLACMASGFKLKPTVIFKRKKIPRYQKVKKFLLEFWCFALVKDGWIKTASY